MLTFIALFLLTPLDSVAIVTQDTIKPKSIMFQSYETNETQKLKYKHSQGFFCDFENKINKSRKIYLNIGVGAQ